MKLRLPTLTLLILGFPLACFAQSLGDVAREVRAEKLQSGAPHTRVITNEDIATPSAAKVTAEEDVSASTPATDTPAKEGAAKESSDSAKLPAAEGAKAESVSDKPAEPKKKDAEKKQEERELETQKRSDEINKRYTDRIAALHEQINTAQSQLAKLSIQQIDSTNEFKRTVGMSPTLSEYEAQQRSFNEQIEVQKNLIISLNSQLEDAREAARHAGVPHALDY